MATRESPSDALRRASNGMSLANYPAIYAGFMEKGIAEADIQPRVNVFTFNAWKAKGRRVRKGEHGVRVVTMIETTRTTESGEAEVSRRPWHTTVFHISQTDEA